MFFLLHKFILLTNLALWTREVIDTVKSDEFQRELVFFQNV